MKQHERNILGEQFAAMLKGGVIMDVSSVDQARVAERAGACAVMALERLPSQIREEGGVARMSDPQLIHDIRQAVSIPVMAKVRIGHTAEARILESIGVDFVDESEVLTPADPFDHIEKDQFKAPFVCGATDLGSALRRIDEGAAMIRTKGEAGTGNVVEAVRHMKQINEEIEMLRNMFSWQRWQYAREEEIPFSLVVDVCLQGRLPVVTFVAGGIATPADAALLMSMGADGVFVGSGIFNASDPERLGRAIVDATVHWNDPAHLATVSTGLGSLMPGHDISTLRVRMQERGEAVPVAAE